MADPTVVARFIEESPTATATIFFARVKTLSCTYGMPYFAQSASTVRAGSRTD